MSRISNESDDGMLSKYRTESPSIDEGNGGSSGGGVILKKGPWTSSEDAILVEYVKKHGEGNWNAVQKHSGLSRCGKSCRLRWANHLRPNLKKGAFTQEEEAMILELHSKIGNKWARMATYMPGRTDNEIKNYWNTRVKRRLRAGLPLYPSELRNSHEENQQGQNTGAMGCGDLGKHDSLQANTFEIPNVVFDGLKRNTDVYSYVSESPNMGMALMKSVASPQYYGFAPQTVHRQKRLRECSDVFPDAMGRVQNGYPPQIDQFQDDIDQFQDDICRKITGPFGPSFLQDLDPGQTLLSFDATQGVHSLSNGNSSASRPTDGAVKLELPSFQYQDADLSTWENSSTLPFLESTDAYIQSPQKTEAFESGFLAPRNSGLLDDLVHEAKHLSSSKKHSSEKSSHASSFTAGDMADAVLNIWDGAIVSTSTPSNSPMSYINEFSSGGSTLEDALNAVTFTGCHVKPESGDIDFVPDEEVELKTHMDLPPDALLNADWFDINGHGSVSDAIATVFNDLVAGYNDERSGSSSASQDSGFDYFAWKRMPSTISQTSFRH